MNRVEIALSKLKDPVAAPCQPKADKTPSQRDRATVTPADFKSSAKSAAFLKESVFVPK